MSEFKILAVDTALGACSVTVLDGARVLAKRFIVMDRGHAEALAPMVEDAMREAGLSFGDLTRLGVTTGPGTFTGQRVGLAFMRALKVALHIPCLGVTTFATMAEQAFDASGVGFAIAAHDARRGEIYCGVYAKDGAVLMEPVLLAWDGAPAALAVLNLSGDVALAGTAAPELLTRLSTLQKIRGSEVSDSGVRQPDAEFVAKLAALMPESDVQPQPLYLRAPDAKLPSKPLLTPQRRK